MFSKALFVKVVVGSQYEKKYVKKQTYLSNLTLFKQQSNLQILENSVQLVSYKYHINDRRDLVKNILYSITFSQYLYSTQSPPKSLTHA